MPYLTQCNTARNYSMAEMEVESEQTSTVEAGKQLSLPAYIHFPSPEPSHQAWLEISMVPRPTPPHICHRYFPGFQLSQAAVNIGSSQLLQPESGRRRLGPECLEAEGSREPRE